MLYLTDTLKKDQNNAKKRLYFFQQVMQLNTKTLIKIIFFSVKELLKRLYKESFQKKKKKLKNRPETTETDPEKNVFLFSFFHIFFFLLDDMNGGPLEKYASYNKFLLFRFCVYNVGVYFKGQTSFE